MSADVDCSVFALRSRRRRVTVVGSGDVLVAVPEGWRLPPIFGVGTWRRRGSGAVRAVAVGCGTVVVEARPGRSGVRLRAVGGSGDERERALEDARFALGLDIDLAAVARELAQHPLLRPLVRRAPWLALPRRTARPFEALQLAVCEQLIDSQRAAAIARALVRRFGTPGPLATGLRDAPPAARLAAAAPAEIAACGLAPARAQTLRQGAEVVVRAEAGADSGSAARARWHGQGQVGVLSRLAAIPGVGPWTLAKTRLEGLGDADALPAADLAYLKLVGALGGLGRRASEEEVREFFAPFAPLRGFAATLLARAAWAGLLRPPVPAGALPLREAG